MAALATPPATAAAQCPAAGTPAATTARRRRAPCGCLWSAWLQPRAAAARARRARGEEHRRKTSARCLFPFLASHPSRSTFVIHKLQLHLSRPTRSAVARPLQGQALCLTGRLGRSGQRQTAEAACSPTCAPSPCMSPPCSCTWKNPGKWVEHRPCSSASTLHSAGGGAAAASVAPLATRHFKACAPSCAPRSRSPEAWQASVAEQRHPQRQATRTRPALALATTAPATGGRSSTPASPQMARKTVNGPRGGWAPAASRPAANRRLSLLERLPEAVLERIFATTDQRTR